MRSVLPEILQLWRTLRRRRMPPMEVLLAGFAGPLVTVLAFAIYAGMRDYAERGWPVYPLILGSVLFWLLAGLSSQIQLHGDREWSAFVRHMPVGPAQLLTVHMWTGLPLNLAVAVCIASGLAGAGVVSGATLRGLVLAAGMIWVLGLQVAYGMLLTRTTLGRTLLLAGTFGWGLLLTGGLVWALAIHPVDLSGLYRIFDRDPLLWLLGATPLVHALLAPADELARACWLALAHVTLVVTGCLILSWRVAGVPPAQTRGIRLPVRLTSWLRLTLGRLLSGPQGAQVCIEWVRTLRSSSVLVLAYSLAGLMAAVILRVQYPHSQATVYVLPLLGAILVCDTVPGWLDSRRGGRLYDLYAVESRHYLCGFVTSAGALVTAICLAQAPIFWNGSLPANAIVRAGCACAGIAFAMVSVAVAIEHRLRVAGLLGRILAGNILMAFAYMLFVLGLAAPIVPLVFATAFVAVETRRTSRLTVKRRYWGMRDDPPEQG